MSNSMDISVIIPAYNEADSLPELSAWIARVMQEHGYDYEVLFVDDGSTDGSWAAIRSLAEARRIYRVEILCLDVWDV